VDRRRSEEVAGAREATALLPSLAKTFDGFVQAVPPVPAFTADVGKLVTFAMFYPCGRTMFPAFISLTI
jgi:hypothetical protein